jgi:Kinetochore complex Sim4 subunit Fta1
MDWCHTWSIHPVMVTTPSEKMISVHTDEKEAKLLLSLEEGRNHFNDLERKSKKKKRPRCNITIDSMSIDQLEKNATHHLRRYGYAKAKKGSYSSTDDGDFVRVFWIGSSESNIDGNNNSNNNDKHLYVEVRIREAFSAAVTFCYFGKHFFSFCLARGLRSSYETIFGWIATVTDGRTHVGLTPLRPHSNDLANTVASWISMEYLLRVGAECNDVNGDFKNKSVELSATPQSTAESKPLILTFATPKDVAEAGLDTITLSVPPQALWKLYTSIRDNQPETCKNNVVASRENVQQLQLLPMVRAMQCYILEAFAIDISTFPLAKVVTASATLGSDGRYKPTEVNASSTCNPKTLFDIRRLVELTQEER